jgi:hypothetical protein
MKVKYTIEEVNGNVKVSGLTIQDLSDAQLEYIRQMFYGVMEYHTLFTKEDRTEFGGQNLINQVADHLKHGPWN